MNSNSQNLVRNEILQNVFFIKSGNQTGTCFLVSINNGDYLITAKHLFSNTIPFKSQIEIELFQTSSWQKRKVTLLTHTNPNIDIAVLDLKTNNQKMNSFDLNNSGYSLSQECFFIGFPFGLKMDDRSNINNGFPLPFVKKGVISAFMTDSSKMVQIFLDGHNNPGFSGGPVVVMNNDSTNKNIMKVIGVVSAYLNESKIVKTPLGDFQNSENSGIVLSYGSSHIYEILERK